MIENPTDLSDPFVLFLRVRLYVREAALQRVTDRQELFPTFTIPQVLNVSQETHRQK